jgi:hypothetical protein
MTVKELRDKLDAYIKKDPPDTWQLNDCTLDKLYYDERCEERANRQVVLIDDGMQPKYFRIEDGFGTTIYENTNIDEKVFAITFDEYLGKIR